MNGGRPTNAAPDTDAGVQPVRGVVRDASAVAPGVEVVLANEATGVLQTTTTNGVGAEARGGYSRIGVPPDHGAPSQRQRIHARERSKTRPVLKFLGSVAERECAGGIHVLRVSAADLEQKPSGGKPSR